MCRLLLLALLLAGSASAENFGNVDPLTVLANPSNSTAPAKPMPAATVPPGTKPNENTIDSVPAMQAAFASGTPVLIKSNETYYALPLDR